MRIFLVLFFSMNLSDLLINSYFGNIFFVNESKSCCCGEFVVNNVFTLDALFGVKIYNVDNFNLFAIPLDK